VFHEVGSVAMCLTVRSSASASRRLMWSSSPCHCDEIKVVQSASCTKECTTGDTKHSHSTPETIYQPFRSRKGKISKPLAMSNEQETTPAPVIEASDANARDPNVVAMSTKRNGIMPTSSVRSVNVSKGSLAQSLWSRFQPTILSDCNTKAIHRILSAWSDRFALVDLEAFLYHSSV
jgi:hypothetical protein